MKRRVFQITAAVAMTALLVGGIGMPAGIDVYNVIGIEQSVRAASSVIFNESKGTLTLSGEISAADVQAYANNDKVKKVVAEEGCVFPTDSSSLFANFKKVTDFRLEKADVSKVESMRGMFCQCTGITQLRLETWDTSSVTDVSSMFSGCKNLSALDLNGMYTGKVTVAFDMFYECEKLKTLNLGSFNTLKFVDAQYMFYGCSSLKTIWVSTLWNLNSVGNSNQMFTGCTSLKGGAGTAYDSAHVNKKYAVIDTTANKGYLTAVPTFSKVPLGGPVNSADEKMTVSWETVFAPKNIEVHTPDSRLILPSNTTSWEFGVGGPYVVQAWFGDDVGQYTESKFYVGLYVSSMQFDFNEFEQLNCILGEGQVKGKDVKAWAVVKPEDATYVGVARWQKKVGDTFSEIDDEQSIMPGDVLRIRITAMAGNGCKFTDSLSGTIHGITATITSGTLGARYLTVTLEVPSPQISVMDMYRLFNPNSGEHFYTASIEERDNLTNLGWKLEGVAWRAPSISKSPVHRLYNPNAGDHHYTMSEQEKNDLVALGWNYEGIGWYSDDNLGVPLHRLYNPNAQAGAHHYTTSVEERDNLIAIGWRYEGIAWYGVK